MQIVYNVTVNIDAASEQRWLMWMREKHIPEVLSTGCFTESRLCRVHGEEDGGATYATMYIAKDQATYDRYVTDFAPKLQADHQANFGGHFAAFRTILSVVHQFTYES